MMGWGWGWVWAWEYLVELQQQQRQQQLTLLLINRALLLLLSSLISCKSLLLLPCNINKRLLIPPLLLGMKSFSFLVSPSYLLFIIKTNFQILKMQALEWVLIGNDYIIYMKESFLFLALYFQKLLHFPHHGVKTNVKIVEAKKNTSQY